MFPKQVLLGFRRESSSAGDISFQQQPERVPTGQKFHLGSPEPLGNGSRVTSWIIPVSPPPAQAAEKRRDARSESGNGPASPAGALLLLILLRTAATRRPRRVSPRAAGWRGAAGKAKSKLALLRLSSLSSNDCSALCAPVPSPAFPGEHGGHRGC